MKLCVYIHMWAPHAGYACNGAEPISLQWGDGGARTQEPNDAPAQVMALGLPWEVVGCEHPSSLLHFGALHADIAGDGSLSTLAALGNPDPD